MRDFKNLNTFQKKKYNHILDVSEEKEARLKPIREKLSRYTIHEIWEMNDYQIAKITNRKDKNGEIMYATFINYESLHHFGSTFDHAVLICLAGKYENPNSMFPMYAAKMLDMKVEPESI